MRPGHVIVNRSASKFDKHPVTIDGDAFVCQGVRYPFDEKAGAAVKDNDGCLSFKLWDGKMWVRGYHDVLIGALAPSVAPAPAAAPVPAVPVAPADK